MQDYGLHGGGAAVLPRRWHGGGAARRQGVEGAHVEAEGPACYRDPHLACRVEETNVTQDRQSSVEAPAHPGSEVITGSTTGISVFA
jgi:hypothetical protein